MPRDMKFWLPVHEAGHAVVAIAAGATPEFVRVYYGEEPGGVTCLPEKRTNHMEWEIKFMAAGVAAEMMIYHKERSTIPQQDMLDAAVDRSRKDRAEYRQAVNFIAMGINPTDGAAINAKFFNFAIHDVKPIIENRMPQFAALREALQTRQFVGMASIRKIVQGKTPTQQDIELDEKQEHHVRANLPYIEEPESFVSKLKGKLRGLFPGE